MIALKKIMVIPIQIDCRKTDEIDEIREMRWKRQHNMNIILFNITLYYISFDVIVKYISFTFNILFIFTNSYTHQYITHIYTNTKLINRT